MWPQGSENFLSEELECSPQTPTWATQLRSRSPLGWRPMLLVSHFIPTLYLPALMWPQSPVCLLRKAVHEPSPPSLSFDWPCQLMCLGWLKFRGEKVGIGKERQKKAQVFSKISINVIFCELLLNYNKIYLSEYLDLINSSSLFWEHKISKSYTFLAWVVGLICARGSFCFLWKNITKLNKLTLWKSTV